MATIIALAREAIGRFIPVRVTPSRGDPLATWLIARAGGLRHAELVPRALGGVRGGPVPARCPGTAGRDGGGAAPTSCWVDTGQVPSGSAVRDPGPGWDRGDGSAAGSAGGDAGGRDQVAAPFQPAVRAGEDSSGGLGDPLAAGRAGRGRALVLSSSPKVPSKRPGTTLPPPPVQLQHRAPHVPRRPQKPEAAPRLPARDSQPAPRRPVNDRHAHPADPPHQPPRRVNGRDR
jgi:hypothetical protein